MPNSEGRSIAKMDNEPEQLRHSLHNLSLILFRLEVDMGNWNLQLETEERNEVEQWIKLDSCIM